LELFEELLQVFAESLGLGLEQGEAFGDPGSVVEKLLMAGL
jgi:hypothetical protein